MCAVLSVSLLKSITFRKEGRGWNVGGTVTRLGGHGPQMPALGSGPDSAWWAAFGFMTGHGLRTTALHKDGVGYKKIAKTLKLSCSTLAKTIQRFNRTGSPQNRPRHGRPKKLSAHAQRHMQRLCLGNRCMSAASIAAEVKGVGG